MQTVAKSPFSVAHTTLFCGLTSRALPRSEQTLFNVAESQGFPPPSTPPALGIVTHKRGRTCLRGVRSHLRRNFPRARLQLARFFTQNHPPPSSPSLPCLFSPLAQEGSSHLVLVNILLYTLLSSAAEVICFRGRCFFLTRRALNPG